MTQLLLSLAEYEKSTIVQRLNRGKERRFSDGHRTCGNIPFGYEFDDNDNLVLNKNHKRTIRFIYRRWMQLGDLNRTRRMHVLLYELGRRGYAWKDGTTFNYSRVRYILKNAIYSGQLAIKNLGDVPHVYESIISKAYYKRVQLSLT